MKKLEGLKNSISSFENKKLSNLKSIVGGTKAVRSNCPSCPDGVEYDHYSDDGKYLGRVEVGCQ
jgi:putative peptide modification target (TIGR04139 family)